MSTVIATAQSTRPRRPSRTLVTAILIVGLVAVGLAAPGEASAGPKPTTSWYISPPRTTITPAFIADIRAKGKALGADVATSAAGDYPLHRATVMLDFGGMTKKGSVWGTVLLNSSRTWIPLRTVRNISEAYARGFYEGSRNDPPAFLTLMVATNNSRSVSLEGGKAWANNNIDLVNAWLRTHGPTNFRFSRQVHAQGGNDIEAAYSAPQPAIDWVTGYTNNAGGGSFWVFLGDCNGCPPGTPYTSFTGATITGPSRCAGTRCWTVDQQYQVAYGIGGSRLQPQIFAINGVNAAQWESIAEYAFYRKQHKLLLRGSLTQHLAGRTGGILDPNLDNTDRVGWGQLNDALNGTALYSGRTAPASVHLSLPYATDIGYDRFAG